MIHLTRQSNTKFSTKKLASIALVSSLMLTMTACVDDKNSEKTNAFDGIWQSQVQDDSYR